MNASSTSNLKESRRHNSEEYRAFPCAIYQTRYRLQKGLCVKHHWHDEVEILHFPTGGYTLEVNMETYPIESECLFFVNPGELHAIFCSSPQNAGNDAILFHPNLVSFETTDAAQLALIQPIQSARMLFPRCIPSDHAAFSPALAAFREVFSSFGLPLSEENPLPDGAYTDDLTCQLFIKSALLRILAILLQHRLFVPTEPNHNRKVEGIKTALTFIREHYDQKIYISDLAALLNINEQYFCRYFKKALGRSPIEYLNEYRIKQAKHLLAKTDLSVMEVSLECGYNNLGHFFREFRKYTDSTPLQYRRRRQQ